MEYEWKLCVPTAEGAKSLQNKELSYPRVRPVHSCYEQEEGWRMYDYIPRFREDLWGKIMDGGAAR